MLLTMWCDGGWSNPAPVSLVRGGTLVFKLLNDVRGQGMVEYGLIVALVAVLLIAGLLAVRGGLDGVMTRINNCLTNASQGNGC